MPRSIAPHEIQPRVLRTLALTQSLTGVGVGSTVAAGGLLVAAISHSESLAGLAQTFSVLGAAAMALPLASLTRRGGRRLALSTGYAIATIGTFSAIAGGLFKFLPLMLLGTFMIGASSAANYQSRFAAADLSTAESRAKDLSFVVWASTIGAVLGPNLMAPSGRLAVALGLPRLTGPYILACAMLLLGAANIWWRLQPDPYLTHLDRTHGEHAARPAKIPARDVFSYVRSIPNAAVGLSAIAIGHVAMVSIMVMTPVHMSHVDVSLTIIGLVISVHIFGMYAFSPLVGRLSDRLGRLKVIQIGVILLLLAGITAGSADAMNASQLGVGLFLLGLGWSCTLIAGSTLLTESISDEMLANVQGTSDTVMNLSGAIGGACAGLIIASLGYGWLCAIASIPVLVLGSAATRRAVAG